MEFVEFVEFVAAAREACHNPYCPTIEFKTW